MLFFQHLKLTGGPLWAAFCPRVTPKLGWKAVAKNHHDTMHECVLSRSVMSNSLWPHEMQHARPPCPSPTPGVQTNPCPLSQWYHPTISSSFAPFSPCPQLFLASGSFTISQFFASGGQSSGASVSTSVLSVNIQDWLDRSGWLVGSLCCPRDSQESSLAPQLESISSSVLSLLHGPAPTSVHNCWKIIAFTIWTFVSKMMSLLSNMLSRFVIAFLPRKKCLLILWLQSPSAVILSPRK